MFFYRRWFIGLWLLCGNESWFFVGEFQRTATAARSSGDGPFAETIDGWECNRHAVFVEPLGNLAISPMFAAQRENGFAVRLQFAARPLLFFILSLLLQIHFAFSFQRQ